MAAEPRRIVVDTSVARRADDQEIAAPPQSGTRCRDFLLRFYNDTNHRVVMTAALHAEWRQIVLPRGIALQFLTRMRRHGRVHDIATTWDLSAELLGAASCPRAGQAMLEDQHLLAAALETDRLISSCDEEVRALFAQATQACAALRELIWVNPEHPDEEPQQWLLRGAPADLHRRLSFYQRRG